ncbi:MAG: response regulator [Candidatus Omnitrophota bacterium]|nr:response regulator [Candidatus Omnitrophota bacterium]
MAVNKTKILVIDDEKDLCFLFKKILTPEGYTVFTAGNGYDGIKINQKSDPDIILLDLKMPGIDGIETLRRIRKKDSGVIVIIITGYGDAETIREAEDLNVYEYMSKPFNNETVRKTIKEAAASKDKDD